MAATRARTCAALAAFAAVLVPAAAMAAPAASSDLYLIVVGADDGLGDLPDQLRDILGNPPLQPDRRIQVGRAERFRAGDLFDLELPDANHPTAWVVVQSPLVHIRAAGAGRAQFVFRDITISWPMTELDRERVGQTLRAAVTVLLEARPGSLGRAEAQQTVDFKAPRPSLRPRHPSPWRYLYLQRPAYPRPPTAISDTRCGSTSAPRCRWRVSTPSSPMRRAPLDPSNGGLSLFGPACGSR